MKKRLDRLVFERGLTQSREKAQALIMAGVVLVNDKPVTKSGALCTGDEAIRLKQRQDQYVSRGAYKLLAAVENFAISCEGKTAIDIGASTGGFTEVLLLKGAEKIFSIDVGINQMDWKIRSNPKVRVLEKINARYIEFETVGEKADLIVIDVSFISLEKVLPSTLQFAHRNTDWITLIKPQFEVGKADVGKGGVVKDPILHEQVNQRIKSFGETLGLNLIGLIKSPITGTTGNREFLGHWKHKEFSQSPSLL